MTLNIVGKMLQGVDIFYSINFKEIQHVPTILYAESYNIACSSASEIVGHDVGH